MKTIFGLIGIVTLVMACHSKPSYLVQDTQIIFLPEDRRLVENSLEKFSSDRKTDAGELTLKVATSFLGTPYLANTLETGADEKMVINLRELDCTTFAENVLALTITIQSKEPSFDRFVRELEQIRYRDGERNGYLSRLHYFSDWIFDNQQKKVIKDMSRDVAHTLYPNHVNFMSNHMSSYRVLNENPELKEDLIKQEKLISERMAWYIPKKNIREYENTLKDGDIVAITTHIDGLDVMHVGFVVWSDNRVRLLHASSKEERVVISEETLEEYLHSRKSATGIMVARVL
jgi:hypothetical protein